MNEKPNYYAIIPAEIRYDKDLRANEKLLYGEITALTKQTGECWASNNYFCELYNVKSNAIAVWIRHLKEKGYIDIEYKYKGNMIQQRIIKIGGIQKDSTYYSKEYKVVSKKIPGGIQKDKENNINNNNINNNNNIKEKNNKKENEEIIAYLNDKLKTKYKSTTPKTQQLIKARLNEGFTIDDFKKVIDNKYNEWFNNEKMNKYLRPETLFGTKFESYLNQNVKKRDSEEEILRYLEENN